MFQTEATIRKGIDEWGCGNGCCFIVNDGKTIVHFRVIQKASQACNVCLGLYALCHNKYSFASETFASEKSMSSTNHNSFSHSWTSDSWMAYNCSSFSTTSSLTFFVKKISFYNFY